LNLNARWQSFFANPDEEVAKAMLSSVSSINPGLCLIFIISLTGCGGGDESVPNGALSNNEVSTDGGGRKQTVIKPQNVLSSRTFTLSKEGVMAEASTIRLLIADDNAA
jgi:hypothetical protein